MKIKLLPLILLSLAVSNVFGQQAITKKHKQDAMASSGIAKKNLEILKSILPSPMEVKQKKTRAGSRLIAQSSSDYVPSVPPMYEPSDTGHYYYKSNYGYDPTPELFEQDYSTIAFYNNRKNYYDSSLYWIYDGGSSSYLLSDSTTCGFGLNHKIQNERVTYMLSPYYSNMTFTYDVNERLISDIDTSFDGTDTTIQKTVYTYNTAGKLIYAKIDTFNHALSSWVPMSADSVFYDVNSNLSKAIIYEYDLVNSIWVNNMLLDFTYSVSNQLTQVITQFWAGSWTNTSKSAYLYNGSNQLVSATDSYWDMGSWINSEKDSFQYSAGPYPSIETVQLWDNMSLVWTNNSKMEYTYNSLNQVVLTESYFWNPAPTSSWANSTKTIYYYENFTPASIQDASISNGRMKVYPVPANELLHIDAQWDDMQTSVTTISDITGKVLVRVNAPSTKHLKQQIDMSMLPAGMYILSVNGEQGVLTQKIIKE